MGEPWVEEMDQMRFFIIPNLLFLGIYINFASLGLTFFGLVKKFVQPILKSKFSTGLVIKFLFNLCFFISVKGKILL